MRIILINPNITQSVTEQLARVAKAAALPGTRITARTAPRGVSYISNRAEAQLAGAVVLEVLADEAAHHDAAIIAAFGDPGLWAARELFDIPIVGMAEAALHTAAMLGERFSIVTFAPALGSWYRDCVRDCGLASRLAAIRSLTSAFGSVEMVADEQEAALADLCRRTVREDAADVVVLAGAPLAGLSARIAGSVGVPLVEQAAAAVAQAELLARLHPAGRGAARNRAGKQSLGLPASLTRLLGQDHG